MGSAVKNLSGLNPRNPNVEYKPSQASNVGGYYHDGKSPMNREQMEARGITPMPQFMPWWMDGAQYNPNRKTNRRLDEDRGRGSRLAGEYFSRFHGGGDK